MWGVGGGGGGGGWGSVVELVQWTQGEEGHGLALIYHQYP